MTNYYVYYRIEPGMRAELARAVRELFEAVAREAGVRGRWMRRRDDPTTCMEIYERVRDGPGFEALLARETQLRGFERFLAPGATRRAECFVAAAD
jgi:quinol monooxygenase YgiN